MQADRDRSRGNGAAARVEELLLVEATGTPTTPRPLNLCDKPLELPVCSLKFS